MSNEPEKEILKDVLVFRNLQPEEIEEIKKVAVVRRYPKGTLVFSEKDEGDSLFVVASGEVRISRISPSGIEKTLAVLGARTVFGEMSLLDGKPRSANATTDSDCVLLKISKTDLDRLISNNSIAAYKVIHAFARILTYRLRRMNDEVIELLSEPDKTVRELLMERGEGVDFLSYAWKMIND